MSYENLLYDKEGHVGTVTLNRPEHLNAFSPGMGADIAAVFDEMAEDDDVRVTILTGAGRGFSAGAFVKDPGTHALDTVANGVMAQRRSGPGFNWDYPKPLIIAVNWLATSSSRRRTRDCAFRCPTWASSQHGPACKRWRCTWGKRELRR